MLKILPLLLTPLLLHAASTLAAPPTVTVASEPSGVLPFATTQATLKIATDTAATCRYGAVPGTAYASISNSFTVTGGTNHTSTVSGLLNGRRYNFYIRCSGAGGVATSDYVLSFSVQSSPGLIPSDRLVDWTPELTVGVPGGIPKMPYSAPRPIVMNGVVVKTIPAGKTIDVTAAPYFASRSAQSTTGTIGAGSNQLSVTTVADFAVGQYILVRAADTHIYDPAMVVDLATKITAINGTTLTLSNPAKIAATNTTVLHNDIGAIMQAYYDAQPGDVVFLPAGRYMMHGQALYMYGNGSRDMITVRGAGMNSTILDCTNVSTCVVVGTGVDYLWSYPAADNIVLTGLTKGSTSISVANATPFIAGNMMNLRMSNDPVLPVFGTPYFSRGQIVMVTGKTGNTIHFWPPLYDDYGKNGVTVKALAFTQQSDFVGIEDLTIEANHSAQTAISFLQTFGGWIKGVRTHHTNNFTVGFGDSLNGEIRHSLIDEGKVAGSNGWGIGLGYASGCLIEDNTILRNSPTIEINGGSSGNVIAYNYSAEPLSIDFDTNHGPHNSFNLYEGNVVSHIISDGYFGGESHATLFRNWIKGGGWWTVNLKRWSRDFSVVGNVLGLQGNNKVGGNESYGNPNIGNESGANGENGYAPPWSLPIGPHPASAGYQELDTDVLATTIRKANFNYGTGTMQSLAVGESLPPSLFRGSKPDFFGALVWPPIDPANPPASGGGNGPLDPANAIIPAAYRFINGAEPPGISNATSYSFAVSRLGAGDGRVVSSPVGIDCGADCSETVAAGTTVVLTALPAAGSSFGGWVGGGCTGTATCIVTRGTVVNALFSPSTEGPGAPANLKVNSQGS